MEKITKLGKFLRIIRINTGESAQDMAQKLGMSPSYLSTIENGKRNVPADMEERLNEAYDFSESQKIELRQAIVESSEKMKIDLNKISENKRHVIFELTKDDIDDDTIQLFREIIANKRGK